MAWHGIFEKEKEDQLFEGDRSSGKGEFRVCLRADWSVVPHTTSQALNRSLNKAEVGYSLVSCNYTLKLCFGRGISTKGRRMVRSSTETQSIYIAFSRIHLLHVHSYVAKLLACCPACPPSPRLLVT